MTVEPSSRRIPYQPGLDGLRGVAVAAVLLYHGGVTWARGGFLGVDVFFVLSGYLITALLVAEWHDRGSISLVAFWARRARRLLPALLVVLAAVAAFAAVALPADELATVRGDGLAGLFYVANWHLIVTGQSYFDQFRAPSALNHLWSLGIEEQWYLVWPLLVAAGLRLGRGRARPLAAAAAVLAAASAVLMALLVPPAGEVSRVYYGTDTRAQSLLAGAVLALVIGARPTRAAAARAVQACGVAGAAVLAVMVATVEGSDGWLYRGGFALAAVAAAAVIVAAVQPEGAVRRALGAAPLVAVGRASYGLYLWHWPVYVALSPARTGLGGAPLLAVRVAATGVIAAASLRWVERPIRSRRWLDAPAWSFPAATATAAAVVASLLLVSTVGARQSLPVASAAPAGETPKLVPLPARPSLAGPRTPPPPGRARALLVGDSVAFSLGYHYAPGLVPGLTVKMRALIGCGVVRGQHLIAGRLSSMNPRCENWPSQWSEAVRSLDPDVTAIMIGAWEVYDHKVGDRILRVGSAEYERYLLSELETGLAITGALGAPVAVLNVPCYRQPDLELGRPPNERNDPARAAWLNRVLATLVARHSARLHLVDMSSFLCPGGRYVEEIDGVKMRRDGVHFTTEGAQRLWRWLGPQLEQIAAHPGG